MGILLYLQKLQTITIPQCQFCGHEFEDNEHVYFRLPDNYYLCKKCEKLFTQRGNSQKMRHRSVSAQEEQEVCKSNL